MLAGFNEFWRLNTRRLEYVTSRRAAPPTGRAISERAFLLFGLLRPSAAFFNKRGTRYR